MSQQTWVKAKGRGRERTRKRKSSRETEREREREKTRMQKGHAANQIVESTLCGMTDRQVDHASLRYENHATIYDMHRCQ